MRLGPGKSGNRRLTHYPKRANFCGVGGGGIIRFRDFTFSQRHQRANLSGHPARWQSRQTNYATPEAAMSANAVRGIDTSVAPVDMKFEIVVIPVSDVDRAKQFYAKLGWRLDADFDSGKDFRVIQFTPLGSGCSVIFGRNVTAAAPGSAQGLYLIVNDIAAARAQLLGLGVKVSEVFHDAAGVYAGPDEPYLFGR